jgi:hypothetical protein
MVALAHRAGDGVTKKYEESCHDHENGQYNRCRLSPIAQENIDGCRNPKRDHRPDDQVPIRFWFMGG